MKVQQQIREYIAGLPEAKRGDIGELHRSITEILPGCKLWFDEGKNEQGKVVSNPAIGYGAFIIRYADGKTKEFFQVGISANTSGISVYILGIKDRAYLPETFGKKLGKAKVTGYCIKFKKLADIDIDVLKTAVLQGVETSLKDQHT